MRISHLVADLLEVMDADGDLEIVQMVGPRQRGAPRTPHQFYTYVTFGIQAVTRRVYIVGGVPCVERRSFSYEPDAEDEWWVTDTDEKVLVWP